MEVVLPDGLRVTLADRLDFVSSQTITKAIALFPETDPDIRTAAILAMCSERFILFGVVAWSLPDEVNTDNLRRLLLTHPDVDIVVEAADGLYQSQVIDPLVRRASRSSEPSQTEGPTSPTPSGKTRSRKPSRPSSISTIQTVDTGTMSSSLDGDFNYSPSSESVAS